MRSVFIIHTAATLFMLGVIWFVQIVHYPLFSKVSADKFVAYEKQNMRLTFWIVMPPMVVEAITATLLVWRQPEFMSFFLAWFGLALLAIIWLSTALLQAPKHKLLASDYDEAVQHSLVSTNWIRTITWTGRSVILIYIWMAI